MSVSEEALADCRPQAEDDMADVYALRDQVHDLLVDTARRFVESGGESAPLGEALAGLPSAYKTLCDVAEHLVEDHAISLYIDRLYPRSAS